MGRSWSRRVLVAAVGELERKPTSASRGGSRPQARTRARWRTSLGRNSSEQVLAAASRGGLAAPCSPLAARLPPHLQRCDPLTSVPSSPRRSGEMECGGGGICSPHPHLVLTSSVPLLTSSAPDPRRPLLGEPSLNRQRRVPRHRRRHNTAAAMTPLLPPFPNTVPWQAGTTSSVAAASPT